MSSKPLTVYIYESEATLISEWTLQYKRIETGGDLFGLWQSESEVVVQAVLGPGKNCKRTQTSFFQDEPYLSDLGGFLTSTEGLCNIGGWHSHHIMNLPNPSSGDAATIWRHLPTPGRFLLLIASIEVKQNVPKVSMTFSLFDSSGGEKRMLGMKLRILKGNSPLRNNPSLVQKMSSGGEHPPSNVEYKSKERELNEGKTCGECRQPRGKFIQKDRVIRGELHFRKIAGGREGVFFRPSPQAGHAGHVHPQQRMRGGEPYVSISYPEPNMPALPGHDDRRRIHQDDDCCSIL